MIRIVSGDIRPTTHDAVAWWHPPELKRSHGGRGTMLVVRLLHPVVWQWSAHGSTLRGYPREAIYDVYVPYHRLYNGRHPYCGQYFSSYGEHLVAIQIGPGNN